MGLNCESISTTSKLYTPNVKLTKGATENGAQIRELLTKDTDTSLATSQNPTSVEISPEEAREAIIVLLGDEYHQN